MIKGEGSAASMSCISLCHNKRTVLRHLISVGLSQDESFAGFFYHLFGHGLQMIDL